MSYSKKRPRSPSASSCQQVEVVSLAPTAPALPPMVGTVASASEAVDASAVASFSLVWSTNTSAVVTLRPSTSLCISGRCTLKCHEGQVEVLGYRLDPEVPAVALHSPSWSTAWSTVTCGKTEGARLELESNHCRSPLSSLPSFSVCDTHDENALPTVVPETWKQAVRQILQDWQLQKLVRNKQLQQPSHAFYQASLEASGERLGAANRGFIVAVAGAKGVGKSHAAKYALHSFLSENCCQQVAWLDADPGQPECAPPTLLALTVLTGPLLQQAHEHMLRNNGEDASKLPESTHAHCHEQAFFFGSNTSQTNPEYYLECIRGLKQAYERLLSSDPHLPLLVNMDGWIKGLGSQVLQAVLDILQPDHVIQITGDFKSQALDLTEQLPTHTVLYSAYSFNSEQNQQPKDSTKATSTIAVQPSSVSAFNLRALRLATYLCDTIDPWETVSFTQNGMDQDATCEIAQYLSSQRPYVVPWEAVDWRHNVIDDDDVHSDSAIGQALNGTAVGLCRRHDVDINNSRRPLDCVGLGLVRSVDRVRRLFYIITPVSSVELQRVNVLARGRSMMLPLEFTFRGVMSESFPYQSFDEARKLDLLGADPMKSRNSLARKSSGGGNS